MSEITVTTLDTNRPPTTLALVYGALLLRLWLAVRCIQTSLEKFAGTALSDQGVPVDGVPNAQGLTSASAAKEYAWHYYQGVPGGLMKKFEAEPLMAKFALPLYDRVLGPVMLLLGVAILLGLASRTALFVLGLIYISLTWGLILIKQDDGVSWLGIHMLLVVGALALADHNRFTILKKW